MISDLMERIKKIRDLTNLSFSLCKESVLKTNTEDEALDYLKKHNFLNFYNISKKHTNSGLVKSYIKDDFCFSIKINCETDFVSKNSEFLFLLDEISFFIINNIKYLKEKEIFTYNEFIKDEFLFCNIKKILGKSILFFKENIIFSDFRVFLGVCGYYNHLNNSITSIVNLSIENYDFKKDSTYVTELAKDIAMQIAAMNPLYISIESISKDILEKERENILNNISQDKKHSKNIDFIVKGKLNKFFNFFCLLEQNFIKDENFFIKDLIDKYSKLINKKISISNFFRIYV